MYIQVVSSTHPNCKSWGNIENLGTCYKCYIIGTRILKIYSEIAEIFEFKVGTSHFEKLATLTSIIWAISESIFLCLSCSKVPEFFKTTPTLAIRMSRSRQNNRNKVNTQLWDTL